MPVRTDHIMCSSSHNCRQADRLQCMHAISLRLNIVHTLLVYVQALNWSYSYSMPSISLRLNIVHTLLVYVQALGLIVTRSICQAWTSAYISLYPTFWSLHMEIQPMGQASMNESTCTQTDIDASLCTVLDSSLHDQRLNKLYCLHVLRWVWVS